MKQNRIFNVIYKALPLMLVLFGLYLGWNMVMLHLGEYTPDSFSYYDISQTIGNEFGRVYTIRQYVLCSDYNCSFPYLYPLFIRLTDILTNSGMYAGMILNLILMPFTALLFMFISKRLIQSSFCGAAAAFLLFTNTHYLEEVYAARSIPLSIFLTASAVYVAISLYLDDFQKKKMIILLGVLAGMNMMNRFDEISLAAFLVPVLFIAAPKKKRLKSEMFYFLGLIPVCVPWIVYSLIHFGTVYISDNRSTMTMVKPEVPSYVFLPDVDYGSLQTTPKEWFSSRLDIAGETMSKAFSDSLSAFPLLMILFVCGLLGFMRKYGKQMKLDDMKKDFPPRKVRHIVYVILLYEAAKFMMYILVGYVEPRYYSELLILLQFALLVFLIYWFKQVLPPFTVIAVPFAVILILLPSELLPRALKPQALKEFPDLYKDSEWTEILDNALKEKADPQDSVLMVGKTMNGFLFGPVTCRHTYVSPEDPTADSVFYVMENYADAEWIALSVNVDTTVRTALAEKYPEIEYEDFYLYHLEKNMQD